MSSIRKAVEKFRSARATDRLFTWAGVHITKIHIYGVTAGGMAIQDFHEGRVTYSLGVLLLAVIDLADDL